MTSWFGEKNKETMIHLRDINEMVEQLSSEEKQQVSDGYHTFAELYEHRIILYITLCRELPVECWKSKVHSDGSVWDGWFLLGINKKAGEQITYHLPVKYWNECWFAETLDKAPEFDGHTSQDVLKRLMEL